MPIHGAHSPTARRCHLTCATPTTGSVSRDTERNPAVAEPQRHPLGPHPLRQPLSVRRVGRMRGGAATQAATAAPAMDRPATVNASS